MDPRSVFHRARGTARRGDENRIEIKALLLLFLPPFLPSTAPFTTVTEPLCRGRAGIITV